MFVKKTCNKPGESPDGDDSSVASFGMGPRTAKPQIKIAWTGGGKVDEENFLSMQQQYLQMKKQDLQNERKIKQLTAQLARTEEAAKRSLVQSDASARGGVAQRLLDAERLNQKINAINHDLEHKLEKERKRASDLKLAADKSKKKVDSLLQEQRRLVRRVGELESRKNQLRRTEEQYLSEEAGQRFMKQQEELVSLREENQELKFKSEKGGWGQWEQKARALEKKVNSLQSQLQQCRPPHKGDRMPLDTHPAPLSPSDWVLEDMTYGNHAYLMDPSTRQLFNYTGKGEFPKPVGDVGENGEIIFAQEGWIARLVSGLDGVLKSQQRRLREAYKKVTEGGSQIPGCEHGELLLCELFGNEDEKWLIDFFTVLVNGQEDEQLTFEEIRTLLEASRSAVRAVKERDWHFFREVLVRVQTFVRDNEAQIRDLHMERCKDSQDTTLDHREIFSIIQHAIPGMTPQEHASLLILLKRWNTRGCGLTFSQVLQAMEIRIFKRGSIPRVVESSPQQHKNSLQTDGEEYVHAYKPSGPIWGSSAGRIDVISLEKELEEGRKREEKLRAQNSVLRREISETESRCREVEDIAMLKDPGVDDSNIDSQIKAAWQSCSAFKKRYLECRNALDTIKMNHEQTLQQLSDTHAGLQEKTKRCYKLESEISKLNVKVLHVEDLEAMLKSEREDLIKAEKDLLEAQQKAFAAPGNALKEVTNLRREILDLQRCKSQAEHKEAEVRRELLSLRMEITGISADDFHRMEKELREAKQHIVQLKIELEASTKKIQVYRQTQASGISGGDSGITGVAAVRYPDDNKTQEELKIELSQLREVYAKDREQLNKLQAVLDRESDISLEARAALENAEAQLERVKKEMGDEISKLKRDLDKRQEKIHQLEEQLKGTVTGLGRALVRSSQANKNLMIETAKLGAELKENENIFELQICGAQLQGSCFGEDPSTFISVDFFEHDTQATSVVAGLSPNFDEKIRYVVESDDFFVKYLDTSVLVLELNQARGWDYDPVATGRMALRRVIEEAEVGSGVGDRVSFHHADLVGATGAALGSLRFGFRLLKPIHMAIIEYRKQNKASPKTSLPTEGLSHIRVIVHRCEGLKPMKSPEASRPYVSYKSPGKEETYDTQIGSGVDPVFQDEATFEVVRNKDLEDDLKDNPLQVVIYDEADVDGSEAGIIGAASVPLDTLLEGIAFDQCSFPLAHPVSQEATGSIVMSIDWHQPLQMPAMHYDAKERLVRKNDPGSPPIGACWPRSEGEQMQKRDDGMITAGKMGPTPALLSETPMDHASAEELKPLSTNSPVHLAQQSPAEPSDLTSKTILQEQKKEVAFALPTDRLKWPNPAEFLIVHVISVMLDPVALACPEIQSVIVVQSFLDELCSVNIQGSQPVPKARGSVEVNHAVGYNIHACETIVKAMIQDNDCRMYLGVVSQIDVEPMTGTVASRVSTEGKGGVKYLDIGMVEIDLLKLRDLGTDLDTATLRIPSSDKYKSLTGAQYLGDMKLTVFASEALGHV